MAWLDYSPGVRLRIFHNPDHVGGNYNLAKLLEGWGELASAAAVGAAHPAPGGYFYGGAPPTQEPAR